MFVIYFHPWIWNWRTLNFNFCQTIHRNLLEVLFNFSPCHLNFYFVVNLLNKIIALNGRPTPLVFSPLAYSFSADSYCLSLGKLLWAFQLGFFLPQSTSVSFSKKSFQVKPRPLISNNCWHLNKFLIPTFDVIGLLLARILQSLIFPLSNFSSTDPLSLLWL